MNLDIVWYIVRSYNIIGGACSVTHELRHV